MCKTNIIRVKKIGKKKVENVVISGHKHKYDFEFPSFSDYSTISLISHASKVTLKVLHTRLQ